MVAVFNEIVPYACAWLRNLIKAGHIAPGLVKECSIATLTAEDLQLATQAHFFAGIGVWSHALRVAGWPDDVPVWTGSCPCQPFSAAGRRRGFDDSRHLWPSWFRLIGEHLPPVVFGEQVASKDGLVWLDAVCADLEDAGYAVAAANLCAAGVGAPHIRQRLYFVAHTNGERFDRLCVQLRERRSQQDLSEARRSLAHVLGDPVRTRIGRNTGAAHRAQAAFPRGGLLNGVVGDGSLATGAACGTGDSDSAGQKGWRGLAGGLADDKGTEFEGQRSSWERRGGGSSSGGPTRGYWAGCDWVPCRDGKWRPVEPGTFPLVDGTPSRVGRLRAYGNAIVAPCAAEFIAAVMDHLA